jgi:hypothetical protein
MDETRNTHRGNEKFIHNIDGETWMEETSQEDVGVGERIM